MLHKKSGFPDKGDLVIATVKRVLPHCAFVLLEEYKDREAMLHISEISSSWTKNIRNHVQEGNLLVLKVMNIDTKKEYIDVSLKRVSDGERKNRLSEWKIEKRMERLLEVFGKNKKKSLDEIYELLGDKIVEIFGSLSTFYNAIREQGEEILEDLDAEKKLKKEFFEMVAAQIKKTRVTIKRVIEVTSHSGDGVNRIRDVLQKIPKIDNIDIEICYLSAPKYSVTIKANNYKEGEAAFDNLSESLKENAGKKEVALKIENE